MKLMSPYYSMDTGTLSVPISSLNILLGIAFRDEFENKANFLFCDRCGKCKLENVKVINRGINWNHPENIYWKHDVQRFEAVQIMLHGNAEFEASDVVLEVSTK